MAEIGGISVKITADTAGLQDGVKKAESALGNFRQSINRNAGVLAKYSAGVAAAGAAVAIHLVDSSRKAIDAQAKLAQQLGTTSASMATLSRAADLSGVSLEQIRSGTRALTVRLAQAANSTGPAVEALDRLGLSAEQVSQMPLDQRLELINTRIRETIPAAQQAAVAAQLFGEEAGTAFAQLSAETLQQARSEAELFGTALSDVDAAKVELANDALATIGMALDGVIKQFTVELAPALKAIGDAFKANAEEAGGFGSEVTSAFQHIITGTGFVLDAVDGIKRAFEVVADGIVAAMATVAQRVSQIMAATLEAVSKLPGVDFSETAQSLRDFQAESEFVVAEAMGNIEATLMREMPSVGLQQFVEDARAAGQAAAEAAVQAREAAGGAQVDGGGVSTGLSAEEQEALQTKLDALREASMTEVEIARQKWADELEVIKQGLANKQLTMDEAHQLSQDAAQRHNDTINQIEADAADKRRQIAEMEAQARRQALGKMFNDLSTLMNSGSRKMFETGKAAAIAQTVIGGIQGAQQAFSSLSGIPIVGPALGIAAAGAALAASAQRVSAIRSQSFKGGGSVSAAATSNTGAVNAAGAAVGGGGAAGGAAAPSQLVNVSLNGTSFSDDQVRDLLGRIQEAQADGGRLGSVT